VYDIWLDINGRATCLWRIVAYAVTARQLEARFRADAEHDYQDGVRYGRSGVNATNALPGNLLMSSPCAEVFSTLQRGDRGWLQRERGR